MNKIIKLFLIFILLFPVISHADDDFDFTEILQAISKIYGVNLNIENFNESQLKALSGKHDYGRKYHDKNRYSWGEGSGNWQQMLALSHQGGGTGQLGSTISRLSKDFPTSGGLNSPNQIENDYYDLQTRTALAARASSELSYKEAIEQENTLRDLHARIDETEDVKSATDLNNRFASENAMNGVQQIKLLSILINQIALMQQESANHAHENKVFFNLKE